MKSLCVSISPSNTASYSMGTITWEWAISAKSHRIFISFKAQPQEPLNSLYIQHRRTGAILFRWCEICARCVEGDGHDACVLMWLPAVQLFSVRLFEWMTFLREWLISFKQVSSCNHFFCCRKSFHYWTSEEVLHVQYMHGVIVLRHQINVWALWIFAESTVSNSVDR